MKVLVIISCLVLAALSSPVQQDNKRLIKTSEEQSAAWLTQDEILQLKANGQNFIDITDYPEYPVTQLQPASSKVPANLKFQTVVRKLIDAIDRPRIEKFVKEFSESFHNRYYQSNNGVLSQQWLLKQVEESLQGYAGSASVKEFEHTFLQNSVIARIEGSDPALKSEVVILGAHQDSLNLRGSSLQAPGADDNASGSVVVLETLRLLVQNGIIPKRSIEFHWYAGEEAGLLGSGAIARSYRDNRVNVASMINFDVVGYQAPGINDVGIYTDNVNAELTQFLRDLVDEYLTYGRRDVRCGYGCSDHASFNNNGFVAAFAAEVVFHPQMHTVDDDFSRVGFTQVVEFAKLAVGFTIEIAEVAEPSN